MMTDLELEKLLASLPVRAPDATREHELLSQLRTPLAPAATSWWTRRIPLWQAAAACIAVLSVSLIWTRESPHPRATRTEPVLAVEPVIVRIDQPLFASAASAPEPLDPSRWGSLPARD
jgi:hypothetical protein